MSLYADYVWEREGFETIEDEYGFATFKVDGEGCYIRDIFVSKTMRCTAHASGYADQIAGKARERGCTYLTGSVFADCDGTASLKVLLAYGFKLSHALDDMIYFRKEL